ncbi:MAG: hypothetical protein R3Y09_03415 [Clostridia bacterium]
MKKLLFLVTFCAIFFVSCDRTLSIEEVENNINEHYNNLQTLELNASAFTSISNKTQAYEFDFCYNAYDIDTITIISPEEIAGITASIEKDTDSMQIAFENMQIETLMAENLGISPVDVTSFAIFDLKNKSAESISVSDVIKISYLDGEISKDIYLKLETYDIMKVEVYVNNQMVIYCNYS